VYPLAADVTFTEKF